MNFELYSPSKTSLKGWKHVPKERVLVVNKPSKTSLKGWKHGDAWVYGNAQVCLKNFLKGMETH